MGSDFIWWRALIDNKICLGFSVFCDQDFVILVEKKLWIVKQIVQKTIKGRWFVESDNTGKWSGLTFLSGKFSPHLKPPARAPWGHDFTKYSGSQVEYLGSQIKCSGSHIEYLGSQIKYSDFQINFWLPPSLSSLESFLTWTWNSNLIKILRNYFIFFMI